MKQILQSYLRRLTDLSTNNKSLLLLRLTSDHFIDLHDFNFLYKNSSFDIISNLIARKSRIPICPVSNSRDENSNRVSKKLKRLSRIDNYILEERGSKDLYVGWPFIRGKFADGTLVRCPLMFFPVELKMETNDWVLVLRDDVSITFNKSFLLGFGHFSQIALPEEFLEQTLDDLDPDSLAFRTAVYNLLKNSPIELNFNQENFLNELVGFTDYLKADFENNQHEGVLKMFPEAVLGIFPQAGSYLVPDYDHLLKEDQYEDIEAFFLSRSQAQPVEPGKHSADYFHFLNKVREEDTYTPFKQDAFQENALKAIKKGNSMVVQGPPGTGKSQLICNLISDFAARGKRVLLVCQKRAALDVVYERLEKADMGNFVALVHDFKNDRKDIFNKIHNQIERIQEYRMLNNGLDAIQLERNFIQSSRRIDQITEEFEEFKQALFDESDAGISVKELYLISDKDGETVSMKQEYRNFTIDRLPEFEVKLRSYYGYYKRFNKEGYIWRNRIRFAGYGLEELNTMKSILREIPEYQEGISMKIEKLLGSGMDLRFAERIYEERENLKEMLRHLKDDHTYAYFQHIVKSHDVNSGSFPDLLWLSTMRRTLLGCFESPGPEISLDTKDLGAFQEALQSKMKARKNLLANIRWFFFSKDKAWINKVLIANNLKRSGSDYRKLEKMVDYRLNLEHNITRLRSVKWLLEVPEFYLKNVFEIWFERARDAVTSYLIFDNYRNFKAYFNTGSLKRESFTDKVNQLYSLIIHIPGRMAIWRKYFRDARIDALLNDARLSEKMVATLDEDFDALCDFDNLKNELKDYERQVIDRIVELREYRNEKEMLQLFYNSLYMAWIDHIETKFPILRAINSQKFDRMQFDLQEAVKEKLRISRHISLLRLRERTYEKVEFNRLNNMVTYRDLDHQVTKKRQIWPIRKLIQNHERQVFDLLPCWMASPESVSAVFPMIPIFDLVIFDEASQCFAEQGIPAMYRGKQLVVTGDKMQLSPFDLYKIRLEENETDELPLEVDSLLDLTGHYLMQVQLRGHYRSKSLDLIEFSNKHFYHGNLTLLPDKNFIDQGDPAINYIKVDGLWANQTNEVEARKIVELVASITHANPAKEIGVVTFNARQQELIQDLLEEVSGLGKFTIPSSLFVKNIENVQGDERDIIIFSIGYAPDERGKITYHFGSLNMQKGENRLNVAVTRAREKVIVVTSILPQQLRVDDTKNEGPKLLRDYLDYALQVSSGEFKPYPKPDTRHRPAWFLKNRLKELVPDLKSNLNLTEELPFADLTVKNGQQYLGLVLTDDDLYHQSISVKDMHIYTPFTLTAKGWKFMGIYSREYWNNPEAIKERFLKFIPES